MVGKRFNMPKFISDEDMAKIEAGPVAPPEESLLHQFGRAAIESIPVVGAVLGGIGGTAAGPVGTVGGAGLGYAAGKEIEGLAKHYLYDEAAPSTAPIDQLGRVAGNVAEGAAGEMGGQILGKGLEVAAPYVGKA